MYLFLGKMATANPDEADFTCKNPNCPKGIFQWNTILAHVVRAKTCKAFYTDENIKAMREESKQRINSKKANRQKDNYDADKRKASHHPIASTSGKGKVREVNIEKNKTPCKICKKSYIELLSHLNRSNEW